jgi:hypothetical protein
LKELETADSLAGARLEEESERQHHQKVLPLSIYRYTASPVIDEITFRRNKGGAVRAYLHAKPDITISELKDIHCKLSALGLQCTPNGHKGQAVLEVRGFPQEAKLLNTLQSYGWVHGTPEITPEPEDNISLKDKLRKRTLQGAGGAFLVADSAYLMYGYKGASKLDMLGGLFYGMGTVSSLIFGRWDPSDLQIKDLSKKMAEYVSQQNIQLDKGFAANVLSDDTYAHPMKKLNGFLRHYPSELLNTCFAMAGVCVAAAAFRQKVRVTPEQIRADVETLEQVAKRMTSKAKPGTVLTAEAIEKEALKHTRTEGWLDVGLGMNTLAAGMFGTLVKEKKPDPDHPAEGTVDKAWEWVRAHPLSVTAAGYLVSTMCHAISTGIALHYGGSKRRAEVGYRAVFVGANIVAEILVALSSKGHGDGVKSDKSVDESVIALAAQLIAHQPRARQEELVECVAGFLGQKEVLGLRDRDVRGSLLKAVEEMRQNPWSQALQKPSKELPAPETPGAPSWQARVAVPQTGPEAAVRPAH